MGRYDTVLCLKKRIISPDGLCGNHVQPGRIDLPAVQRVRQILLLHKGPSGVVQNDDAVLHLLNIFFADDSLRPREERTVERDHIRPGKEFLLVHVLCDLPSGLIGICVVGQNPHKSRVDIPLYCGYN